MCGNIFKDYMHYVHYSYFLFELFSYLLNAIF